MQGSLIIKSPNIKFGIFNKKDKSKILYLAQYQSETYRLSTALRLLYGTLAVINITQPNLYGE